jgi:hypothetical protein
MSDAEKLDLIRDWMERHSAHAGRAPLAELRAILDGD